MLLLLYQANQDKDWQLLQQRVMILTDQKPQQDLERQQIITMNKRRVLQVTLPKIKKLCKLLMKRQLTNNLLGLL